jgi:hypothetical protein
MHPPERKRDGEKRQRERKRERIKDEEQAIGLFLSEPTQTERLTDHEDEEKRK